MTAILALAFLFLAFSFSAYVQEKMGSTEPTESDKTAAIPSDSYLKRGAPIGNAQKVPLAKFMKEIRPNMRVKRYLSKA